MTHDAPGIHDEPTSPASRVGGVLCTDSEDQLLLHVQGVIAEYERAQCLERSRRGKRHAAQAGRDGRPAHSRWGYAGKVVPKDE